MVPLRARPPIVVTTPPPPPPPGVAMTNSVTATPPGDGVSATTTTTTPTAAMMAMTTQRRRMPTSSLSESEEDEMSLDLWEGQFEFVGGYSRGDRGSSDDLVFAPCSPQSPPAWQPRPPTPRGGNGVLRNKAHVWCDDITGQVQLLQQQMTVLSDNHTDTDDRYTRAKQDSAALQERVHMLEEQLREAELRADDRLADEQQRHRELTQRIEREKQTQIDSWAGRLQTLEAEGAAMREESTRLRIQLDRARVEKETSADRLEEARCALGALQDEALSVREAERRVREEAAREVAANLQLVEVLTKEVVLLRGQRSDVVSSSGQGDHQAQNADLQTRLKDLQAEVNSLHQLNKSLECSNEELQAQLLSRSVEEGRHLLTGTSLAAEFEAMSHEELRDTAQAEITLEKVRMALKEQQEVNSQLRCYIDGILLNIVENYPQLLEVKIK